MIKMIMLPVLVFILSSCMGKKENHPTPQELALIDESMEQHNQDAKNLYAKTHDTTSMIQIDLTYKNPFDADTAVTLEKWMKWCDDHKFNYIEKLDTLKVK